MIKSKKQMFTIIVSFLLMIILGTTTYAFFNYTRTGISNTIKVGRIYFNTTQDNTINLENVFPTDSSHLDSTNSAAVTVNITGDTEYSEGIEYKVSIVDVQNTVNGKEVPISFSVEANDLGTQSNDYYNDRGSTTNVYNLVETGTVENNKMILVGYIKSDDVGVNCSIDITAYLDKEEVGISDTVSRIENGNLVYGETDAEWIVGRTILTTSEWNGLQADGVSFKVKVEANEGIWVPEPQHMVLENLSDIQAWIDIRGNITSIEFHKDGVAPANPITSFDATDITSDGTVTVYVLDDGLGNNTYKVVIVGNDTIYAPENSVTLFALMPLLSDFNSENFRVDNVTNMRAMFNGCSSLSTLNSLATWDVSKVTNMRGTFINCTSIENVDSLINWNVSNVVNMMQTFSNCTALENVDGLINWNTSNVASMTFLFYGCTDLENINGLINWNTKSVEFMYGMFYDCTSLLNADGLVNWNTSSATDVNNMFSNCTSLTNIDLSHWDMSKVTNNKAMFQNTGFRTIAMPNNYTRIDDFMFNHNTAFTSTTFTIPKTVTSIGTSHVFYDFGQDSTFKKFIVESGSTSFKTIDDILYSYDGTRLISVPRGKTFTNNTYEIPEGVTFLNELSFSRNRNIDTVVLPNSYVIERYIDADNNNHGFINTGSSLSVAIYRYTSIKSYEVKSDNPNYSSDSGCIYNKNGTELIAVPLHYTGVLNIKSGTTTIGQEAFWYFESIGNDLITAINIPASVTTIEANQLSTLNTLMSRSTNPVTITIDSGNTAYQISGNKIVAK